MPASPDDIREFIRRLPSANFAELDEVRDCEFCIWLG